MEATGGRSPLDHLPLSSSGPSALSESWRPSARPVQISCCRTASAMGMTMAVVDVLLSHMDRNTVQHMKPSTNLRQEGGERERERGADMAAVEWFHAGTASTRTGSHKRE